MFIDNGTLICVICNSILKNETVLDTHIQHYDSIMPKKQTKLSIETFVPINVKRKQNIELSSSKLKGCIDFKLYK